MDIVVASRLCLIPSEIEHVASQLLSRRHPTLDPVVVLLLAANGLYSYGSCVRASPGVPPEPELESGGRARTCKAPRA